MSERIVQIRLPELSERELAVYNMAQTLIKVSHLSTLTVVSIFSEYIPAENDSKGKGFKKMSKQTRDWYDMWIERVDGLEEQLNSFYNFNSSFKDYIASAIILGKYAFDNHFVAGDLVFNNNTKTIGYAGEIDYSEALFPLYGDARHSSEKYLGRHYRADFVKVGLRKK